MTAGMASSCPALPRPAQPRPGPFARATFAFSHPSNSGVSHPVSRWLTTWQPGGRERGLPGVVLFEGSQNSVADPSGSALHDSASFSRSRLPHCVGEWPQRHDPGHRLDVELHHPQGDESGDG